MPQRRREARLADPRLTGDENHPSLAALCLLPAPQQQVELFIAPDKRRCLGAQCLEATDDGAFVEHQPSALRLGKARQTLRPEILDFE